MCQEEERTRRWNPVSFDDLCFLCFKEQFAWFVLPSCCLFLRISMLLVTNVKKQRPFWRQACTCCSYATGEGGPNATNAKGRKKTKRLKEVRLCSGCQPLFKADRM